jgi:hypothetical protein
MTREPNGGMYPPGEQPVEEHSFDELAKGLAEGTISRRRALKWVGAAVLAAAVPPLFPTQAVALSRRQRRKVVGKGARYAARGNATKFAVRQGASAWMAAASVPRARLSVTRHAST